MKITTEDFIEECRETHNNFYDYPKTVYTKAKEKVIVTCPEHGDFETIAYNHKKGTGCPECWKARREETKHKDISHFLKKSKEVHGDRYDYSKSVYKGNNVDIEIICKEHGSFWQTPSNHYAGKNCLKCGYVNAGNSNRVSKKEYLKRFKEVHGGTYDYSKSVFKTCQDKIIIICKEHGEFKQTPLNHSKGHGCLKCAEKTPKNFISHEEFLEKIQEVHSNLYSYEGLRYTKSHNKVGIVCKKHGYFEQKANVHMSGSGCPKCGYSISVHEAEVYEFLKENNIKVKNRERKLIPPQEIDILCKEHKLAIEYNGLYWHSDNFLDANYHKEKTEVCEEKGYQLIHIFADEWISKKEIIKSRLLNLTGKTKNKIYARKCIIKEVPTKEAMQFLDKSHIQGRVGAKIKIGLYHNDKLVSLMTFGGLRKNLGNSKKEGHYELLRFCNALNTTVIGGASKLFKYFLRNYNVKNVISYADRRWSKGNLYENLGFNLVSKTKPNYFYTKGHCRENRFKYRKSEIIETEEDKAKTEKEIMKERGYYRIYDSGTLKYEYKN